jgi:hypothetical protein
VLVLNRLHFSLSSNLFTNSSTVTSSCCSPTFSASAYGQSQFISEALEKKTMLTIFSFSLTILVDEFKFL